MILGRIEVCKIFKVEGFWAKIPSKANLIFWNKYFFLIFNKIWSRSERQNVWNEKKG